MIESPILITGAARSGTSIVAGIIHLCGAFGGIIAEPGDVDRKGTFENVEIRQQLMRPYFRQMRVDQLGQNPLPDLSNPELKARMVADGGTWWHSKVLATIKRHGYKSGHWFYKASRTCLVWPLWMAAFPHAKWIVVRRNAEDIAESCLRTGYMKAWRTKEGWMAWAKVYEFRFQEMARAGLEMYEVWPHRIIQGDLGEIKDTVQACGLEWDEVKIKGFISPSLWKGGQNGC